MVFVENSRNDNDTRISLQNPVLYWNFARLSELCMFMWFDRKFNCPKKSVKLNDDVIWRTLNESSESSKFIKVSQVKVTARLHARDKMIPMKRCSCVQNCPQLLLRIIYTMRTSFPLRPLPIPTFHFLLNWSGLVIATVMSIQCFHGFFFLRKWSVLL